MTNGGWVQLANLSVTDPAEAARVLLSFRVPSEALWTALVLVAVLNTLVFAVTNILVPAPSTMPGLFDSPVIYFGLICGGLVLTVLAIHWVGGLFGGTASRDDVMILIVWLQGLRVLVQVAALVLMLVAPLLSAILVIAAAFVGLFITLHFIDQAHGFKSLGKSAGVLIASGLAIIVGLSVLLSLIGGPFIGTIPNV